MSITPPPPISEPAPSTFTISSSHVGPCSGLSARPLKHFYTSQLGASGQHDPKTVQALSRHARFSETWETYAHPPRAVEGVTVTTFSGLFAPPDTSQDRAA